MNQRQDFKDWLAEKRELNEIPKYVDHDYIPFKPMKNKTLQFLEAKWDELKLHNKSKNKDLDTYQIFINKRKTVAILGCSVWDDERGSWILQIVSWISLENSYTSNNHRRVIGVHTNEEPRGEGYTVSLYYSLVKNGINLESDNEQYQGAKPLWKALSRLVNVEVYDESLKSILYKTYTNKIDDSEIWSKDSSKFLVTLRTT